MREEYEDALKNAGAVLFIIGFAGVCLIKSMALCIMAIVVMCIGIVLVATADWIVVTEDNRKQKNKGQHRQAHDL